MPMELFAFIHSKKSHVATPIVARTLSKNEKLAVAVAMHLVVNRYGKRRVCLQETDYIQAIRKRVLDLDENDVAAFRTADFDPFNILQAMPDRHKRYFAAVFYQLATLVKDQAVIGRASVVIRELGFSMNDLANPTPFLAYR